MAENLWQKTAQLINTITFILLIAAAFLLAFFLLRGKLTGAGPSIAGYKLFTVMSGSMEPAVKVGSVVVVQPLPPEAVQPGDIITYRSETGRNFITHRVARINSEGALLFYTMGDANEALDPLPAQARQLVGKVALSVPYLGYLLFFFRTRAGLMLLCCLAVLFIAGELIRTILLREKKGLHSAGEEVAELRINRF
ncbi:MAG: signal peptidase I [Dethiobacteria bacterium]